MMTWIIVSVAVLILDTIFGDPQSRFHPVALLGNLAARAETFCRFALGCGIPAGIAGWCLMTLPLAALAAGTTWVLEQYSLSSAAAWTAVLGYCSIALKSLIDHSRRIRLCLARGDLAGARRALSMIVSRDTANLTESEVVRGGIESVSENLVDAVTSTLFYLALGYCLAGLPGAAGGVVWLRIVNTLDACWGYRNERYEFFGKFAARADDLAHFLPARLTLAAIMAAALVTGGSPRGALTTAIRCRRTHPSPNSIWAMAAFAGALRVRLGGPTLYRGGVEPYPYWGDGRSNLSGGDLKRAERLAAASSLMFWLFITGGCWLWLNL